VAGEATDPAIKIRRISRVMVLVTVALALLLVVVDIWLWVDRSIFVDAARRQFLPSGAEVELTSGIVVAGLALGQLSFALALWALWNVFALFRGYRDGAVLTVEAGRRLRHVGVAFCAFPFVQAAVSGLSSALLTMNNPPGERHLAIALEGGHLIIGVAGALMIVVGWVLAEAARIADDNRQIV
jgi:Protein of unknown function (DUF2975)